MGNYAISGQSDNYAAEDELYRDGDSETDNVVEEFKSQVRNTPDIATVRTEEDVDAFSYDRMTKETVAFLFEITHREYGTKRLLNSIFAGNNDIANVFTQIINFLKNGKGNNRLQSSDGNGTGESGTGASRTSESQGGERMGRVRAVEEDSTRPSGRGTDEVVRSLDERESDNVSPFPVSAPTVEGGTNWQAASSSSSGRRWWII